MDKITLYYFTVGDSLTRGRGENVKLLLEDAGLEHDYIRVKHEEWPELKQKLQAGGVYSATLPFIEINGQNFVKAPAIMRYISTKLGGKYHGSTPEEDQILDVIAELNDVWFEHLKNSFFGSDEMKAKYANETLPAQISLLEKYYSDREGPYLLGEKLTYADILIYHMIDDGGARNKLNGTAPSLLKFVEAFEERPNLKKHFATLK